MQNAHLTIEQMIAELREISRVADIDADVPIIDLQADSLRILEWLYVLEDLTGLSMEQQYAALQPLDELTIRRLHSHLSTQMTREAS